MTSDRDAADGSAGPLEQGCVAVADYEAFLRSETFAGFEREVAGFLETNRDALAPYKRRWVGDPLHNWSRAWEYPFAEGWLGAAPRRVLDAGSGITFFPYRVARRLPAAQVHCLDQDAYLAPIFERIRHPAADRVRFRAAPLESTGLPAGEFDAIYCISVLEHTTHRDRILAEFRRLLAPGGRLVVTLDISLDGRSEIPLSQLPGLLDDLVRHFRPLDASAVAELRQLDAARAAGLVTTGYALDRRPTWLPWRHPRLSGAIASVRQGRLPHFAVKQLTFACLAFE
jgi:SAM-dependent methyltransferase